MQRQSTKRGEEKCQAKKMINTNDKYIWPTCKDLLFLNETLEKVEGT